MLIKKINNLYPSLFIAVIISGFILFHLSENVYADKLSYVYLPTNYFALDDVYDSIHNVIYATANSLQGAHSVFVIDTNTNTVVKNIPLSAISNYLALDEINNKLYVTTAGNIIYVIDTDTNEIIDTISADPIFSSAYTNDILFNPVNESIYVSLPYNIPPKISVIDIQDKKIKDIFLGGFVGKMKIANQKIYATVTTAVNDQYVVCTIDALKNQFIECINTGPTNNLSFDPLHQIMYLTQTILTPGSSSTYTKVGLLDTQTDTLSSTSIPMPITGGLQDIEYDPTKQRMYVSKGDFPQRVYAIDTNTNTIKEFVDVFSNAPALSADPVHNRMYVTLQSASAIGVIDINSKPTVEISSPSPNSVFNQGEAITFTGMANDEEDGDISSLIEWSSSIDGALGQGSSISVSNLTSGQQTITASINDTVGQIKTTSVNIFVNLVTNNIPTLEILSPSPNSVFNQGEAITFTGMANDEEDGDISSLIEWSSSIDGALGQGSSISVSTLSLGLHDINVTIADTDSNMVEKHIVVGVIDPQAPPADFLCTSSSDIIITGTKNDDELIGNDNNNVISGKGGNDRINGCIGNDQIGGNAGDDIISGGQGDDNISGGAGADYLYGSDGNDILNGNAGDDVFFGGAGNDVFNCGPGKDTVQDFVASEDSDDGRCEVIN